MPGNCLMVFGLQSSVTTLGLSQGTLDIFHDTRY